MAADPRAAWAEAMVSAQAAFPEIKKGRTVTIETSKGKYSYDYADLPSILEIVQPILTGVGLAVTQAAVSDQSGAVGVETRIYHVGGHVETFGPLFLAAPDDPKAAGSAVTYARRYSLCAALGIAADEDDDATSATESRQARTREPIVVPTSPDDPHCPACLAVHGAFVPIIQGDRKPFQRCTANPPEDCGAPREYQGKTYTWAGWHRDWRNSVREYNGQPIVDDPTETLFDTGRAPRSPYIVQNTMQLAGLDNETDAKLLVKPGLILAISEGRVDAAAALGGEIGVEPTDEELRTIISNVTLAEADAIAAYAAGLRVWDEDDDERPFE